MDSVSVHPDGSDGSLGYSAPPSARTAPGHDSVTSASRKVSKSGRSKESCGEVSLPTPASDPIPESSFADPTRSGPMSEVAPVSPEHRGAAKINLDEVSHGSALVSPDRASDANQRETELVSHEVTPIPESAIELSSGSADPSD